MSDAPVVALLIVGCGCVVVSALGVLVFDDMFDRLHYLAPAAMVAPAAIGVAVLVREGLGAPAIKSLLVALVSALTSPVLTHATARAARTRQLGHWASKEGDQRAS